MLRALLKAQPADPLQARLIAAKAARDAAHRHYEQVEAGVARVREVVASVRTTDRAARAAHAAAVAATAEWTASGADPAGRQALEALERAAAEADRIADAAQLTAQAAQGGLGELEIQLRMAKSAIVDRNAEIGDAVEAILLADAEPQLAALAEATRAYVAAVPTLRALLAVAGSKAAEAGSNALRDRVQSALEDSQRKIHDALTRSGAREYDHWLQSLSEEVAPLAGELLARIRTMRDDPPPRWLKLLREEREAEGMRDAD